jgi:hypothetical protein
LLLRVFLQEGAAADAALRREGGMERADGEKREERELVGVEVERPIAMWSLLSLPLLVSLLFRYSPLYSKTTPAFAAGPQG